MKFKVNANKILGLNEQEYDGVSSKVTRKNLKAMTEISKEILSELISNNEMDLGQFQTYFNIMKNTLDFNDDIKKGAVLANAKAKETGSGYAMRKQIKRSADVAATETMMDLKGLSKSNEIALLSLFIGGAGKVAAGVAIGDLLANIGYIGPADAAATAFLEEFDLNSYSQFMELMINIALRPDVNNFLDLKREVRKLDSGIFNPPRVLDLNVGGYVDNTVSRVLYPNLQVIFKTIMTDPDGYTEPLKVKIAKNMERAKEIIMLAIKNGEIDEVFEDYKRQAMRNDDDLNLIQRLEFLERELKGETKDYKVAGELAKTVAKNLGSKVDRESPVTRRRSRESLKQIFSDLGGSS